MSAHLLPVFAALILALPLVTQLDVAVEGPGWTSANAVRRLMATQEGRVLDDKELQRDLARLRTLAVFSDVVAHADGGHVNVEVTDRWSLFPVVGVRRGGGHTTSRLGVTDHDAFGQLITAYAELTSNADLPFVARRSSDRIGNLVYLEVPRILGTQVTPFLSWTRDFLDFAAFTNAGAGYVYDRARYAIRGELRYELTALVVVLIGAEGRLDRYRTSDVTQAPGTPPAASDARSLVAGAQFGYVEDFVSQQRGTELRITGEAADSGPLSAKLQARGYFVPSERHNLCLQLQVQATTAQSESFLFRAGGLREIRGFIDAYFAGAFLARANAEWRIDVIRGKLGVPFIGQLALFADGGYVAGRRGAVAGLDYEGPIVSAGAGVRGIPVPFAKAVGRIDAAFGLEPRRTFDVSFSGQQFF